jgi:transposase InsO family protein
MRLRIGFIVGVGRKLRVCLVVRFSTDEQKKRRRSNESQVKYLKTELETEFKRLGIDAYVYTVIADETLSGELLDRPGIEKLRAGIRSDNGAEFTATKVRDWLERINVKTLYIEPGSPWENGYVESFNGKLRDELLEREIFDTLWEAKSSSNAGGGKTTRSCRTVRSPTGPRLPRPLKHGLSATLRSAKRPCLIQQKPNITLRVTRGGRSVGDDLGDRLVAILDLLATIFLKIASKSSEVSG